MGLHSWKYLCFYLGEYLLSLLPVSYVDVDVQVMTQKGAVSGQYYSFWLYVSLCAMEHNASKEITCKWQNYSFLFNQYAF